MKQEYTAQDLKNYKIAVLCGGDSNEREISLISGEYIFKALQESELKLDVHKIDPKEYDLLNLKKDSFNLVFNTLHGRNGEDGRIHGFLEVLGIKYTGVNVEQAALTLDKVITKKLWLASDVNTAKMKVFNYKQILNQPETIDVNGLIAELGLPLFVKPSLEGSSIGITKVKTAQELLPALVTAAKIDHTILVEQFIDGKEFSVPVLNGKALAAIEIIPPSSFDFYNYEAKYFSDETQYICPARLNEQDTKNILELAEKAANAMDIKTWVRIDVLSDKNNNFYALEANTNPGMTSHSLFPMAAKQCGMSYQQLCIKVLVDAINDVERG